MGRARRSDNSPRSDEAKRRLDAAVQGARRDILELSHRIHANPEPAFEEVRASAWVAELLDRHGFRVEHPVGRLSTAVRAVLSGGRGSGGPRIALLGEYDALPGLGHGCGHNTMAAAGAGAAIALAALAKEIAGEIVFLGTPAEERGSGKQVMIEDGLFDGIDAALLYHPCDRDHVEIEPLASEDAEVVFTGLQAHAAMAPWEGRNALDAMILLFSSVGLWRQQLRPDARVHGIIREGGTAANIIPDRTAAWFILRTATQADYPSIRARFEELCQAAALATGTRVEVTFSAYTSTMQNNRVLTDLFRANMAAAGRPDQGPDGNSGSTDMANVSWVCPAIQPELAIAPAGTPKHSLLFRDAACSPTADETTLLAATLLAQTAWDLFADPSLVDTAWRAFRSEPSTARTPDATAAPTPDAAAAPTPDAAAAPTPDAAATPPSASAPRSGRATASLRRASA